MLYRWTKLGFIILLLTVLNHNKVQAEQKPDPEKYKELTGRILNLQVNPIVLPTCLVTCEQGDGIGDDDWASVPLCHSNKSKTCSDETGQLTPAIEMEVWLEPVGTDQPVKLILITTHNLYMPLSMNMSTRYISLNLPNLITSMAEMEYSRKNIQSKFYTTQIKELGEVIVGAEIIPLKGVAYEQEAPIKRTVGQVDTNLLNKTQ